MATPYGNFTTLSTGTLSTGTLAAGFLSGDGSGITNLSYKSYVPYSIPWTAMQAYGGLNVQSGTWLHGGLIAPNSLSVATAIETHTLLGGDATLRTATIGTVNAAVINTYYISTNTFANETNFFGNQYGRSQYIVSSFMSSLYAHTFKADDLGVQSFTASTAAFSSLTTSSWLVDNLQPQNLTLYDTTTGQPVPIALSTGILYIGTSSIYSSVVMTSDLVSTTNNIGFRINVLSNYLNPFPALSAMSSVIGSNFQVLQKTGSTLSTSLGTSVEIQNIAISNVSVGLQTNINNLSNYTVTFGSNTSTTLATRLAASETATAAALASTSNYFQTSTTALFIGLSTTTSNLSTFASYTNSNLSTVEGIDASNLKKFGTDLSNLTVYSILSTFSTLSTQTGTNFDITQSSLSTAISNLSVTTQAGLYSGQRGISTIAIFLLNTIASSISTVTSALSTYSTLAGYDSELLHTGISTSYRILSTVGGSNFSTSQTAFSTLSTTLAFNHSTVQVGLSTVATVFQLATSTLSTTVGSNHSTFQFALRTFSTVTGSN
jgi:hypothetical protein